MIFLKYAVITLLGISAFVILIFAIKSKKPFKALILNAILGVAVLGIVDLSSKLTGVYIPINEYTVLGSSIYGLPAICGFLLLRFIFI
ncbi:MAG: pro-sigmaK processing inhibitor BofA family protein [Clostridia bacterium]|nr:pro-sigmaK processing inhibitor BofA family protein [Clostridia bacterium]